MKILLFGKTGQIGWELNRALLPLGEVVALGRDHANFSNPESLRKIVRETEPNVIVNAAAYTSVDKAETEEELAKTINAIAPGVLAEEALGVGALFIHYSTDYVFDGSKTCPYVETDLPNPVNAYGRTKLAGEQLIKSSGCDYLIFRTTWVYASRGRSFLHTVLRLARERKEISIVDDQVGSPTWANLIANVTSMALWQSVSERRAGNFRSGLYNLASRGSASWYIFASCIIQEARTRGMDGDFVLERFNPITTSDYPLPASRPANSVLRVDRLEAAYGLQMPSWEDALSLCMDGLG